MPHEAKAGRWVAMGFALLILWVVACDNQIDENGPFGPTQINLVLTPSSANVQKNGTLTFTAAFGVEPFTWSVNNSALATIDPATGSLTAGATTGTVVVTATDSKGKTGTATVNIVDGTILLSPAALALNLRSTQTNVTVTYTATGAVGTVFYSIQGHAGGYSPDNAVINAGTGVVTIVTPPTTTEGTQVLTIQAADGIVTSGTAVLTITPIL